MGKRLYSERAPQNLTCSGTRGRRSDLKGPWLRPFCRSWRGRGQLELTLGTQMAAAVGAGSTTRSLMLTSATLESPLELISSGTWYCPPVLGSLRVAPTWAETQPHPPMGPLSPQPPGIWPCSPEGQDPAPHTMAPAPAPRCQGFSLTHQQDTRTQSTTPVGGYPRLIPTLRHLGSLSQSLWDQPPSPVALFQLWRPQTLQSAVSGTGPAQQHIELP